MKVRVVFNLHVLKLYLFGESRSIIIFEQGCLPFRLLYAV